MGKISKDERALIKVTSEEELELTTFIEKVFPEELGQDKCVTATEELPLAWHNVRMPGVRDKFARRNFGRAHPQSYKCSAYLLKSVRN